MLILLLRGIAHRVVVFFEESSVISFVLLDLFVEPSDLVLVRFCLLVHIGSPLRVQLRQLLVVLGYHGSHLNILLGYFCVLSQDSLLVFALNLLQSVIFLLSLFKLALGLLELPDQAGGNRSQTSRGRINSGAHAFDDGGRGTPRKASGASGAAASRAERRTNPMQGCANSVKHAVCLNGSSCLPRSGAFSVGRHRGRVRRDAGGAGGGARPSQADDALPLRRRLDRRHDLGMVDSWGIALLVHHDIAFASNPSDFPAAAETAGLKDS
mmetsp:Transcript_23409/g.48635  ORF Transcript_23409/g.48635 Transcript_23409/m.48635 type:complete len:268 (-) Transcript_23409:220-1023(-)